MSKWLSGMQPLGALVMRLVLGLAMVSHGWDKVIPPGGFHGHNTFAAIDHHSRYVAGLGLPYWMGVLSALTEFVGGFALLAGLLTRIVAFLVAANMLVALLFVNIHHGYAGSEYGLALFALALMLLFYGPGQMALDRRLGLT
ncbi:MAG: DoxX family protein [Acidobacteriota bacterium]|nr:DoxX family protein [Acidobacteriota bacterium]